MTADDAVARSLLKSGKDACAKKKYADAARLLAKAAEEAPALPEPRYWLGLCREKEGDTTGALAAYRKFRTLSGAAARERPEDAPDADLLKKAQARICALAPGEAEYAKLSEGFRCDLFALAKSRGAKEPAVAALAYGAALRADPGDIEARGMLGAATALPVRKGETGLPADLLGIVGWNDLLVGSPFGAVKGWTTVSTGLRIDTVEPFVTLAPGGIRPGPSFVLDMEVQLVSAYQGDWMVGWALMLDESRALSLVLSEKRVWANLGPVGGAVKRLAQQEVPRVEPNGSWRRVSARIVGNRVELWAGGKRPLQFSVDGLAGKANLGIAQTACVADLRVLRWAVGE